MLTLIEITLVITTLIRIPKRTDSTFCMFASVWADFRRVLRIADLLKQKISVMSQKSFSIHGRACLWAMDMPQSKRNENRYFDGTDGAGEWQIDSGEYQI
jgi:hypothetical protein